MSLIARIEAGVVAEYPIDWNTFQARFPNVSFPAVVTSDDLPEDYVVVEDAEVPAYNAMTETYAEGMPVLSGEHYVRTWLVVPLPPEVVLTLAKVARIAEVEALTVTTASGKVFDGDEKAQDRMTRAISSLDDVETTKWILANNDVVFVTKAELKEALRLAGAAMTEIWVRPYE